MQASLKLLAHLLCLVPALLLGYDAWHDRLGADPIQALTHGTGLWALRLLLLSLAMTPLRRITGSAVPIRYRRMLGLWAFTYACLHLSVYVVLDLGGYWAQIGEDIVKRPFITVGFLAWLCLVPLTATSTRAAMRWLGRRWGQLHKLVYVVGGLVVLHFLWLVKSDLREPLLYGAALAALLALRLPPVTRALERWRSARRQAA